MGISRYPSSVTMPNESGGCETVLEFLCQRFPAITMETWRLRLRENKVLWHNGTPVTETAAYVPNRELIYYREVEQEPEIPFQESILYQDENLLVADKPHFLPVTPASKYVNQTLLYRLRESTGIHELTPVHRIDRCTAGLVMFTTNARARSIYQEILKQGEVQKRYHAVARIDHYRPGSLPREWKIENRIVKGTPGFRMALAPGEINARSIIRCVACKGDYGLFHLYPLTGKTHQLRLHMSTLGFPLVNERYYPELQPEAPDNFDRPLQLLAKELQFNDPISGEEHRFHSRLDLAW